MCLIPCFALHVLFRSKPFAVCQSVVPAGSFLPSCVERVCDCLTTGGTKETCQCAALARYVTKCLEADSTLALQDWRVIAKCCEMINTHCYQCIIKNKQINCFSSCCKKCGGRTQPAFHDYFVACSLTPWLFLDYR